jgi:hypothetical protein
MEAQVSRLVNERLDGLERSVAMFDSTPAYGPDPREAIEWPREFSA